MDKDFILAEIRRTAEQNGGEPFGQKRFASECGIRVSDWRGRFWARWGDALIEAGFAPRQWTGKTDPQVLIQALIEVSREVGRFPVKSELELRSRNDPGFPSVGAFQRLGRKHELARLVRQHCVERPAFEDVIAYCDEVLANHSTEPDRSVIADQAVLGYVYLAKSGKHYKIGRSIDAERRHRELALQLPEALQQVHVITTDDPPGIEAYWHRRFADKRVNGEWFALTTADVRAFKRRKFQ